MSATEASLLGHHHLDEFFVVDLTVTVNIGFTDQLIDFVIGQLFTEVGHDVTQLSSGDETIAVTIEDLLYLQFNGKMHKIS